MQQTCLQLRILGKFIIGNNKNLRAVSDRLWAVFEALWAILYFLLAGWLVMGHFHKCIGYHIYLKTKMPSLS